MCIEPLLQRRGRFLRGHSGVDAVFTVGNAAGLWALGKLDLSSGPNLQSMSPNVAICVSPDEIVDTNQLFGHYGRRCMSFVPKLSRSLAEEARLA